MVDDIHVELASPWGEPVRCIERFWVVDTGAGILEKAVALLGENGWRAAPWDALRNGDKIDLPTPRAQDLGGDLLHLRHDGPSKGVAMPHSQLYFFAQIS